MAEEGLEGLQGEMLKNNMETKSLEDYQEELTETLTEYKRLKDESHSSVADYLEVSERCIDKLKQANAIEKEMLERYKDEFVREASEQAYKDAGLGPKRED